MSFIAELKRRNVFKVGTAYAIVAWLLIEVVATVFPILALPDWSTRLITVAILIGFPIAVFLAWAYELTPEGIKVTTPEGPAQYHTRTTGQQLNYFIMGVLVLAVVFMVVDNYVLVDEPERVPSVQGESNPPAVDAAPAAGSPQADIEPNSIAVLPFLDMSQDKDQEYFADGLTEAILNALAQISGLRVAGRTSSFHFKGSNEDLPTIGQALNVENILEGSVRKSGNKIKITAQFNNATTGFHYWSKTYDRELDDIFKIQGEIANSVAGSLQISLGVACTTCPGLTRNVAAWDEFLLTNKEDFNSPVGVNNVIQHLETAVRIDPDFAIAWNRLGNAYNTAANINPTNRAFQLQRAQAAFTKAEALAPNATYVLTRKALRVISEKGWVEAENLFKQAVATPGTESLSYNLSMASFLFRLGHVKTAIGYYEQARVEEPLDIGVSITLALMYAYEGNYDASLAESERGNTEIGQESIVLRGNALLTAMAANNRDAINLWKERLDNTPGGLNQAFPINSHLDDPEQALALIHQFAASPQNNSFLTHIVLSEYAAYFGENDLALANLGEAARNGTTWGVSYILWHPIFRKVRPMPGFKDIVASLGMVDYWRTTGNWGEYCHPVGDEDFECN